MVTDLDGEITAGSELGVFAHDTRFLSHYRLYANGEQWIRLNAATTSYDTARINLTNPGFATEDREVRSGVIELTLTRRVGGGVHEDFDIVNHDLFPVRFNLEVALRSDFADLFEVKRHRFVRRGDIRTEWRATIPELETSYVHRDFRRSFIYRLIRVGSQPEYANGRVTFPIELPPGGEWHTCAYHVLVEQEGVRAPAHDSDTKTELTELDRLHAAWHERSATLETSTDDVYRVFRRSLEDIGALRMHEHDMAHDRWVPAAGVPWYVTLFGRDSIIVSLQTLWVNPELALGALEKLARMQARERDDFRDAEPGKILHEIRYGELAHFQRIPHTPYYGTADATPLYLVLLHEAWRWLGDDALLRTYRETAERCLEWIDRDGDLDGDGFQEYKRRSRTGYENMGWKDSHDSVVYPDGTIVTSPKALCELQGYVFDAWNRGAEMFDALGEHARAHELRGKARELQRRFAERFWCEETASYAYALDSDKAQVRTIASNAGHCLWSGIALPEHARQVVARLRAPDMWSGWGIRTLTERNPAYNPTSYHTGSVWPHDNGIIALGFRRYGFAREAAEIAHDVFEAGSYFIGSRLPELYGGQRKDAGSFPVGCLKANAPQAWAAGSVFHFLTAMLGLEADAPRGRLIVDPHLPDWLPELAVRGMHVGAARVDLHTWRAGDATEWDAETHGDKIDVVARRSVEDRVAT